MLFHSFRILKGKKKWGWSHGAISGKGRRGAARAFETCPNWEIFTQMENSSSALILIHPSVFISPKTLKHSSSALAQPRGRLAGSRVQTRFTVQMGTKGFPELALRLETGLTFNSSCCYLKIKNLHFSLQDRFFLSFPPHSMTDKLRKTTSSFIMENSGGLFPPVFIYFWCIYVVHSEAG